MLLRGVQWEGIANSWGGRRRRGISLGEGYVKSRTLDGGQHQNVFLMGFSREKLLQSFNKGGLEKRQGQTF